MPVSQTNGVELSRLRRDALALRLIARKFRAGIPRQRAFRFGARGIGRARFVVRGKIYFRQAGRNFSPAEIIVDISGCGACLRRFAEFAGIPVSFAVNAAELFSFAPALARVQFGL